MSSLISALDGPTVVAALGVFVAVYLVSLVVYRRFFHPLAKVPGPFLPAVTTWYQSYYNRRYYLKIEELHKQYGPIVRILPNEIHLADSKNFEKIYYVGSKYTKAKDFYLAFTIPNATFCTIPNNVHRIKRSRLNPMFSRKMVLELEEIVQATADKLISVANRCIESGEPMDLHHMFRCVSVDVITEYSFDKSYNLLSLPDFGKHFFKMVRGIGPAMWAFQQFPGLVEYIRAIPPNIAMHFGGAMNQVVSLQQEGVVQLNEVKARMKAGTFTTERPTIFSELLDPEKQQGYPVPDVNQLKDEVYSILAAAADTTGNAMTVACYNVLKSPEIYATLRKELQNAFPDPNAKLPFQALEKLPYLTGIVKEGLRLSFGVPGRLPRVVPEGGETFNGYFIPAGTVVSMSSWIMQRNPEVFPDPMKFDPSRWIDPVQYRKLDSNMMPFGGGSRQCVGMPLAYCEIYVTIGTFFHRFSNLEVYKTTDDDMQLDDFFSSYMVEGKNWLQAVPQGTVVA